MRDLPPGARASPATARNREPILELLRRVLPSRGLVLEIAAGAGEHAVFNAAALPHLQWRPTDPDPAALVSIAAWRRDLGTPNLAPPLELDASDPAGWPVKHADAIVNINMIHISPWAATEGLMTGAGKVLPAGGVLFLYGPYLEDEVETAPSNLEFDTSLKRRNPAWGLRRREHIAALAQDHGLALVERVRHAGEQPGAGVQEGLTATSAGRPVGALFGLYRSRCRHHRHRLAAVVAANPSAQGKRAGPKPRPPLNVEALKPLDRDFGNGE